MNNTASQLSSLTVAQRRLLELRLNQRRHEKPGEDLNIVVQDRGGDRHYPLSYAQQRIWFMCQFDQSGNSYNVRSAIRLQGALNSGALKKSLSATANRHEILRTTFPLYDQQPQQMIGPPEPLDMPVEDLSGLPEHAREAQAVARATEICECPFDFTRDRPIRATLLRLDEQDHVLVLPMHHIAFDGWSMQLFIKELGLNYESFSSGQDSPLPSVSIQYVDYAVWERQRMQRGHFASQIEYWEKQLDGAPTSSSFPTDRPRTAQASVMGSKESFTFSPETSLKLNTFAKAERVTLFMLLLSIFKVLLHRYSGTNDIVVCTSIANRGLAESEALIGPLLNMLVLRTLVNPESTFTTLLRTVRETALGAYANQEVPFERILEELQPERIQNQTPYLQIAFALIDVPNKEPVTLSGLVVEPLGLPNRTSKFELSMLMHSEPNRIWGTVEYNTDLFQLSTIRRLVERFELLSLSVLKNSESLICDLPFVPRDELTWINGYTENYSEGEVFVPCCRDALEAAAERHADDKAVSIGDKSLSYSELNSRANRLAHYLRRIGAGTEKIVGILAERSIDMMVGLLGVMKTGAAYVALDPQWPIGRLRLILEDAGVSVLLAQDHLIAKYSLSERDSGPLINIDELEQATVSACTDNLNLPILRDSAAYVSYTSGTTGRPKGVVVTQKGLANYLAWAVKNYDVQTGTGSIVHSSISFDLPVTSLFAPLLAGKAVELVPDVDGLEAFCKSFARSPGFSFVKLTPAHLDVLSQTIYPDDAGGHASAFVIGGEALTYEQLAFWRQNSPSARLINEYGPTETVVGSTVYEVDATSESTGSVPIGKPIINTEVYLLDSRMQQVGIGTTGEIYIGGHGVARGYLKRADLTAEKFVPNPFGHVSGDRLYRTGDLARYLPDGNIAFLGRSDDQIKLRGHRIEVGEIESILAGCPAVKRVAVLARESDARERKIVAYFVPAPGIAFPVAAVRSFCAEQLPPYMAPSAYVALEALPLKASGKVDRRRLPAPDSEAVDSPVSTDTSDSIEGQLIQIWEDLLNVRPIRPSDNFFELGGHSLLAVRLMATIQKRFKQNVSLSELLRGRSVSELAGVIRQRVGTIKSFSLVPIRVRGAKPPLFLVHSGNGSAACFDQLSKYLSDDQPLYGLQAEHPAELTDRDIPMIERAALYLRSIREVAPQGPYLVGGYSFGCVVAYEMAQQLLGIGEQVALLALFDGGSPLVTQKAKSRSDAVLLAGVGRDLAREAGINLSLPHEEIRQLSSERGITHILEKLKRFGLVPPEVGLSWVSRLLNGIRLRTQTIQDYSPEPYSGKITLFRSAEIEPESANAWRQLGVDPEERDRGWGLLAKGGIDIIAVPGYHTTVLKEPYVQVLAKELSSAIDALSAAQTVDAFSCSASAC